MVTIAIVVSRVEALVLLSVLEAEGIIAVVSGLNHASVEVNSVALGHRIWVPASQWEDASAILRESGADRDWQFSEGPRRAVLRLIGFWLAVYGGTMLVGVATGALAFWELAYLPLAAIMPVNPQGRGDFYLVADPA